MQNMTAQNTQAKPQALATVPKSGEIEYVAFGGDTRVKLSAKIVQTYLCKPTKRGAICSDQDAIKFMMLCQARALNPFEGDAFLVGYDNQQTGPEFSIITAQVAFLKRAEVSPEFDGMESGVIIANEDGTIENIEGELYFPKRGQELLGGWATVYKKNQKYPTKRRLPLHAFAKDNKFWNSNPGGMICKCAEADALRSAFPTKLGGLYVQEEKLEGFDNAKRVQAMPASNVMLENPEPVTRIDFTKPESEPVPVSNTEPQSEQVPIGVNPSVARLLEFLTSQGYTPELFFQWAKSAGHIPDSNITADKFPADTAERLLKGKLGVINKMKEFSAEVAS
jgi:phage recombination protein Bet